MYAGPLPTSHAGITKCGCKDKGTWWVVKPQSHLGPHIMDTVRDFLVVHDALVSPFAGCEMKHISNAIFDLMFHMRWGTLSMLLQSEKPQCEEFLLPDKHWSLPIFPFRQLFYLRRHVAVLLTLWEPLEIYWNFSTACLWLSKYYERKLDTLNTKIDNNHTSLLR